MLLRQMTSSEMVDGSWEVRCALYGDAWVIPGYVDIQFEYGVHSPLVIVEKGVVYIFPTARSP